MKTELPYMPVIVDHERAIAGDLTNEELGAYYRLKLALWDEGGFLDEDLLVRTSRAGKRWGAISRALLRLLTVAGGKVSCPNVLKALLSVRARRAERVERAAKAAEVRWSFNRAHNQSIDSGKPISGVLASRVSDTLLKSDKSLKVNHPSMLGASPEQCLDDANQNQKDLDNRNLNGKVAAAGRSEGLSDQRSQSAGVAVDNRQRDVLYAHGTELLITRGALRRLTAHGRIANWLSRVGDADRLAMLLAAAEGENLRGPEFLQLVEQRVGDFERERLFGKPLPLDAGAPRAIEGGKRDSG